MRRQFYELRPGETLEVGGSRITLELKSGQRARLRVESDVPTRKLSADAATAPLPAPRPPPAAQAIPVLPRPRLPAS